MGDTQSIGRKALRSLEQRIRIIETEKLKAEEPLGHLEKNVQRLIDQARGGSPLNESVRALETKRAQVSGADVATQRQYVADTTNLREQAEMAANSAEKILQSIKYDNVKSGLEFIREKLKEIEDGIKQRDSRTFARTLSIFLRRVKMNDLDPLNSKLDELDPANQLAKAQRRLTVVSHAARDLAIAVQKNIDNTTTIRRESGQSTTSAYIRDTEIQREALERQRDLIGNKLLNSQNDVDWRDLQGTTDLGPLDEDLEQEIGGASSESLESDRSRRSLNPAEQEKERLAKEQPPEVSRGGGLSIGGGR
jgi:hypothetical protein